MLAIVWTLRSFGKSPEKPQIHRDGCKNICKSALGNIGQDGLPRLWCNVKKAIEKSEELALQRVINIPNRFEHTPSHAPTCQLDVKRKIRSDCIFVLGLLKAEIAYLINWSWNNFCDLKASCSVTTQKDAGKKCTSKHWVLTVKISTLKGLQVNCFCFQQQLTCQVWVPWKCKRCDRYTQRPATYVQGNSRPDRTARSPIANGAGDVTHCWNSFQCPASTKDLPPPQDDTEVAHTSLLAAYPRNMS